METTRRAFLEQVGQGVLLASVGPALTSELGLASPAQAAEGPTRLNFGKREELVDLIQQTPPAKILPIIVNRIQKGTELKEIVAAAALANARQLGGENYVGYHTMMALAPSYGMSLELPKEQQALPVLKVLVRNSGCMSTRHGKDTLLPVTPAPVDKSKNGGEALREETRKRDKAKAEAVFAGIATSDPQDAFNNLLYAVDDDAEVHRVVLAYRSYDMLNLVGKEHAQTMLRQSVRYCVDAEAWRRKGKDREARTLLPKLLDQHKLLNKTVGTRKLDDAALLRLSMDIFKATPYQAGGLAAEALADGVHPDAIGEAITLAACELLLRDEGRQGRSISAGKPMGSVHGDSIGLHACDSANAWRNIARVSNWRNSAASLILGAFQVALDRIERGGDFLKWEPYPRKDHREKVKATDGAGLLREAEAAIKEKNQAHAAAAIQAYVAMGQPEKDVFALFLRYAVSEDGALHAEKFYRTVSEEYARSRAAYRGRFLVGMARVTASAYGQAPPGLAEAKRLLKV